MPDIYLLTEGKQEGPYTKEQVRQSLAESRISTDHPAWHEGLDNWVTVGDLITSSADPTPIVSSPDEGGEFENNRSQESVNQLAFRNSGDKFDLNSGKKNKGPLLKRVGAIFAILMFLIIFGLFIGLGVGFVLSHPTLTSQADRVSLAIPTPSSLLPSLVAPVPVAPATPIDTPKLTGSTETQLDVFRVFQPATDPTGAWFGKLNRSDGSETDVIIDFGPGVTIAEDDEIEGTFVPTSEIGEWNYGKKRIYKVQAGFKFVHPDQ